MELDILRRKFQSVHSALRNEGHNPLEAVSLLADALAPNGHEPDRRLSTHLKQVLARISSDTTAAGLAIAFQQFMVSEARNGLGQYLTPMPVAELIADVVAQSEARVILDPFAGSGLLLERVGEKCPDSQLLGIEINPAVAQMARAASRLARHPIQVTEGDAFLHWTEHALPSADAVVTNPPFGAAATRATPEDLAAVGAPPPLLALGSLPAELLGLELSLAALREGGLLAIVLPQSILTNNRWAAYRAHVFRRLRLRGVVSLPEQTFGPFRGVAKACLIVATKAPSTLPTSFPYWRPQSVGYDETGRSTGRSDLLDLGGQVWAAPDLVPSASIDDKGQFLVPPEIGGLSPEVCYRLGDFADIFNGRTLPRGNHAESGPRLLGVGSLAGSFIAWRPRPRSHVSIEFYNRNRKAQLRLNDICLTAAAHKPRYIGLKVDLVDTLPPDGAMASAEVMVIRLRTDAPIHPVQLLFYLRSDMGYRQIQDFVRGSTAHLYPADVGNLLIPPLPRSTESDASIQAFWMAAKHFREYLRHEERSMSLGMQKAQLSENSFGTRPLEAKRAATLPVQQSLDGI